MTDARISWIVALILTALSSAAYIVHQDASHEARIQQLERNPPCN